MVAVFPDGTTFINSPTCSLTMLLVNEANVLLRLAVVAAVDNGNTLRSAFCSVAFEALERLTQRFSTTFGNFSNFGDPKTKL